MVGCNGVAAREGWGNAGGNGPPGTAMRHQEAHPSDPLRTRPTEMGLESGQQQTDAAWRCPAPVCTKERSVRTYSGSVPREVAAAMMVREIPPAPWFVLVHAMRAWQTARGHTASCVAAQACYCASADPATGRAGLAP